MAGKVLSDEEAEQLSTWPPGVARSDLVAHFTLSVEDRRWVRSHRGAAERIGLAVQLCGLGYLGFVPAELAATPREIVAFVADQAGVAVGTFAGYARQVDGRTRRRHVSAVVEQAGWRVCGPGEWKALGDSLTARALEHRGSSSPTAPGCAVRCSLTTSGARASPSAGGPRSMS